MLIEAAVIGAIGSTISQIYRSSELDEKALKTLKRAHNTHEDAVESLRRHKMAANIKLEKLVNRKKAILNNRIPSFISVYQQIQAVKFQPGDGILELESDCFTVQDIINLNTMATTSMQPMSEHEMAVKFLLTGIGGMILSDSKRNAEIANSQQRIASTLQAQAQNMEIAFDAIGERADQISGILARFSLLFGQSIEAAARVIQKNGTDRSRYSQADLEILMNCVNLAAGIKDILDVPILNQDGSVTEASLKALESGTTRLKGIECKVRNVQ